MIFGQILCEYIIMPGVNISLFIPQTKWLIKIEPARTLVLFKQRIGSGRAERALHLADDHHHLAHDAQGGGVIHEDRPHAGIGRLQAYAFGFLYEPQ